MTAVKHLRNTDLWFVALLLAIVTIVWCNHYGLLGEERWDTPINYVGGRMLDRVFTGDGLWGMAFAKAMADGEIGFFEKRPKSLGAPFGANWNDWPTFEEAVNVWWAFLVRIFGVFTGSNVATLSAHLLAAAAFYWVCRQLRYSALYSTVGAALFALSRYAFWRNLGNVSLTFYWHLPLGLLVCWWCIREAPITRDRPKLVFAAAVAVIHGVQHPYYAGIFLQFLFWGALYALLRWRDWRRLVLPAALAAVLFCAMMSMNVDTMRGWRGSEPNLGIATRAYFDVERYALKPVELLVPVSHSFKAFADWANRVYFQTTAIPTEQGSAYSGVVAMSAFALLCGVVFTRMAKGDARGAPYHFWGACAVLAFSLIGGINGLVGLFGFRLFRASNRYSIVLLTILLLFLVKFLSSSTRGWRLQTRVVLAALLLAIGIYDQVPPRDREVQTASRHAWQQDQTVVSRMEALYEPDSMIFQLPVREFPEAYLMHTMDDYEHFRPYHHSNDLKFSYGDIKGRYRDSWQRDAEQLGAEGLVRSIESYGFSAVLINRDAYPDEGASVVDALRSAGRSRVVARSDDWICIALNPARHRSMPPVFGRGWHRLEGDYHENRRWSSGDASLVLHNPDQRARTVRLLFGLDAAQPSYVEISIGGRVVQSAFAVPHEQPVELDFQVQLEPGATELLFATDREGEHPPNGDPRKLAFAVLDFQISDATGRIKRVKKEPPLDAVEAKSQRDSRRQR